LGTTKIKYWYPLKKICKFLNKNNVIIVSAANKEVIEYLKNEGLKNYYNIYLDSGVEL
jgi:hypothetical protein